MKHCRVSAFARVARFFACAAVALSVGAGQLLAQGSTGKIEGRVRDQAGAAIANAQVIVVGTAFNAVTNPQGYYFINNVPASTVCPSASIGRKWASCTSAAHSLASSWGQHPTRKSCSTWRAGPGRQ